MPFHHTKLANGLEIIGETNPSAKSAAVGFFVRTGSRDESDAVSGVSHFLEHMVFKGTPKRSAADVNRDFDRIGANYNAYTSEENTVFYAAVLPEYLPPVVEILADILRPSLRGDDFDMEKNVIIEEIGMYDDQPSWATYDNARKHYYRDHPLGNTVLGSVESIKALTRDQMQAYYDERYRAGNVLAVASGNFDWSKFVDLVGSVSASWPAGGGGRQNVRPASGPGTSKAVQKAKVTQEHLVMIASAPPAESPLRHAADCLALAIGDDSGSRLYWELVDPGYADSADMGFHEYEGSGSYYTSIACEPDRASENLAKARAVLEAVQRDGITAAELKTAQSKIGSRVVRGGERPMGRLQALGMGWTYLREYRSVDVELAAFEAVTLADVRRVLDVYPVDHLTTLALGPLEAV